MPHVREQHWKELPLREIWDDPDYLDMNQYLDQIRAEAVDEERAAAAASQAFLSVPTQHPTPTFPTSYTPYSHGAATISRLLKIIGLFCRISSLL